MIPSAAVHARARSLLLLGSLLAASAAASEVRVPMQVDFAFLRELLVERAFTDPEQTARVYSDGVECNRVTLLRPELDAAGGRLRVTSDVDASFGTLVLGRLSLPGVVAGPRRVAARAVARSGASARALPRRRLAPCSSATARPPAPRACSGTG